MVEFGGIAELTARKEQLAKQAYQELEQFVKACNSARAAEMRISQTMRDLGRVEGILQERQRAAAHPSFSGRA